ncbi:hypothetical protein K458DRAFT_412878 [Lentithecium fluviatile CBS 122367]|uniref:Small ribosomal subunit protein mS35 mitochondrial conserved domain-containing protein n=1 Tax=Lentithecium fluviatile CBS 122367 TaxID=1168545 RepID=A0A6G1JIQ2_9PLEO|nr:hypothetical protein K458DRAFT_412878 [Lentithecium fluviatile CBS 122367]
MASISRRLFFHTRRCPSRVAAQRITPKYTTQWLRPLSSTAPLRTAEDTPEGSAATDQAQNEEETSASITTAELAKLVSDLKALDPDLVQDALRKGKTGMQLGAGMELDEDEDFELPPEQGKPGFWAEGEESMGPDEDYYGDDLTSLGHGELEQHRELREYARLIAWELPLLSQLARPFEPPTSATPFRFRYTSYLGESHPSTNKVVVEFSASDLSLSPTQLSKLIKLAGPRYNPETSIIKMSCESFDTQAQNKRFLGETISKLLAEAKDGADTFEDVPFDFRHHKPKKRYEFPKEWILTEERKGYLEERKKQTLKLDDQKMSNGLLVDGKKVIETSLPFTTPEPEPVMAGGPRGKQLR